MSERKKLSLGAVGPGDASAAASGPASAADKTKAWNVSPKRAEALKLRARDMRRNPSAAQKLLWDQIKDKKCGGFAFNREVVMGSAIVDFACKPRWLVVETGSDGESETTLAALSDRKLIEVGVRVLRFSDEQVLDDVASVVAVIAAELQKPFEKPHLDKPKRSVAPRASEQVPADG